MNHKHKLATVGTRIAELTLFFILACRRTQLLVGLFDDAYPLFLNSRCDPLAAAAGRGHGHRCPKNR